MAELQIGDVLAGYRIEGFAGRGGMGVVYIATQLALDRRVALKLIAPDLAQDDSFRQRFKRESRTAAQIEHPHVIPVHEAGEADGQLFIAMRFVDGIDLRELIRRDGMVEPARATRLVAQVASALDAAHAHGLVHRDIKPGNVLIAAEGGQDHAYLTDFGLSKQLSSESGVTATGMWVGTLDYISPEQVQGAPLDARSDIYSLGCLLYHAVAGRVPFDRESDVAKIFAHLSDPPPALSEAPGHLPAELDPVVRRAMAKDPAARYLSAGDLGRAALAAVEGRTITQVERSVATGDAAPSATATGTRVRAGVPPAAPATATPAAAPPAPARPRRVPVLAAAGLGLVALLAVLAVAGVFSGNGASGGQGSAFDEGAVTVTPITVDSPGGLALGGGGLWVTSHDTDRVSRIDLASGKTGQPIAVGDGPAGVAVGDGAVWVVNGDAGTVSKVDIGRGEVVGNPIDLPSTSNGDSIAAGQGRVWVVTPEDGKVVAIDASSGQPASAISPPDGTAGELAYGEGGLWVVGDHGTVTRVDPASGKPGTPVKVARKIPPDGPFRGEIAVGEGAVWVAALDDETVIRLDPRTGKVVKTIPFKDGVEGDIAAGADGVWVVNESGALVRIDPRTNAASGTLPAGTSGTNDMTAGADAIWIAGNTESNTVTRVEP